MLPTPTEQARLIRLRQIATSEAEFKKLAWANGLSHCLRIPDNTLDRARQEFIRECQGFYKSPGAKFDLAITILKRNGVDVG